MSARASRSTETAHADVAGTWITFAGGLSDPTEPCRSRVDALRTAARSADPGDYFAFLVYAPDDEVRFAPLRDACSRLAWNTGRAVCLELGPRYLHSTGQLHKGGPNTGVFVMITARDAVDIDVPGQRFSLAALHRAQAEGDLLTLARHGRRVLRLDLPSSDADTLADLAADIVAAGLQ